MRAVRRADLPSQQEGVARVRVFITPSDGMADLSVTEVVLESGSATPDHSHDTDQIVYLVQGEASIVGKGERHLLQDGDLIYIPSGSVHRHENVGEGPLRQLSIFVPGERRTSGERKTSGER